MAKQIWKREPVNKTRNREQQKPIQHRTVQTKRIINHSHRVPKSPTHGPSQVANNSMLIYIPFQLAQQSMIPWQMGQQMFQAMNQMLQSFAQFTPATKMWMVWGPKKTHFDNRYKFYRIKCLCSPKRDSLNQLTQMKSSTIHSLFIDAIALFGQVTKHEKAAY